MLTKRIIPCLDVNNGRVVKGVNFVNLQDAGDPVAVAKAYDEAGADEVVFLDITASSDHRNTVVDMVRKVAANVFIPFTVGGGIRTVDDFRLLLMQSSVQTAQDGMSIRTVVGSMWVWMLWNGQKKQKPWEQERFFSPVWMEMVQKQDTI